MAKNWEGVLCKYIILIINNMKIDNAYSKKEPDASCYSEDIDNILTELKTISASKRIEGNKKSKWIATHEINNEHSDYTMH